MSKRTVVIELECGDKYCNVDAEKYCSHLDMYHEDCGLFDRGLGTEGKTCPTCGYEDDEEFYIRCAECLTNECDLVK